MHDRLLHTLGLVSASWNHHSAGAAPLDQEFGPSILYPIYGPMRWSSVLPRTLMAPPNGSVKLDHEPFAEEG
jgi:hypothetical protein